MAQFHDPRMPYDDRVWGISASMRARYELSVDGTEASLLGSQVSRCVFFSHSLGGRSLGTREHTETGEVKGLGF